MSTLTWIAPILWPFLAAVLVLGIDRGRTALVASGPLPSLALAMLGAPDAAPELPWVLLDLRLGLDATSRVLLLTTALVWLAAGLATRRSIAQRGGAAALWLLTLGGNVGLVLAADVVSLYALYGVMTFAAYGLVVHDRTAVARRAGRLYVVMAVFGEVLLLSGLVLAVGAADSTDNATVAAALAEVPHGQLIIGLLAAGFAVKAGIVPLHVWLPLAHPAAPVPASAALSGAMIKAGLVGWLTLLPLGSTSAPGWSATFVGVGLLTAFWGVAVGLVQDRPKVVLAYSSISQMGLIAVLVGLAFASPTATPLAVAAAVTYALHHGVAKGALFLGVGVHSTWAGPRGRLVVLAGTVLAGLSLAGAPLSSGWVAKGLVTSSVAAAEVGWARTLTWLLSLAAVGTTLLIARLLVLLARPLPGDGVGAATAGRAQRDDGGRGGRDAEVRGLGGRGDGLDHRAGGGEVAAGPGDRALVSGWGLLLVATLALTWTVPSRWLAQVPEPEVYAASLRSAAWPVLLGLALSGAVLVLGRRAGGTAERALPRVPAGDLAVLAEAAVPAASRVASRLLAATVRRRDHLGGLAGRLEARVRPGEGFARLDVVLRRWQVGGVLFVLLGAALIAALTAGG
ncbi:MAG: complex I subunit 5 family protein [Nitriliruptoraceae bacterium]